jgi:hypothetical protein
MSVAEPGAKGELPLGDTIHPQQQQDGSPKDLGIPVPSDDFSV